MLIIVVEMMILNYELFEKLKKKHYIEPYSIIIEAPILIGLFRDEEQTDNFLSICYYADSVLCCRVSPFQKSQIVHKMKKFDPNFYKKSIKKRNIIRKSSKSINQDRKPMTQRNLKESKFKSINIISYNKYY